MKKIATTNTVLSGEILSKIPHDILKDSGIEKENELLVTTAPGLLIIRNHSMSAIEMAYASEILLDKATDFVAQIAHICGVCNNCGDKTSLSSVDCSKACGLCKDLLTQDDCVVDPSLLKQADISPDEKLDIEINDEDKEIIISVCEDEDIRDVPPRVLYALQSSGVCLPELDESIFMGWKYDID